MIADLVGTSPRAVLLASGGLDSTVLAYWLAARDVEFSCLFLDYGQHCAETELAALRCVLPIRFAETAEVARIGTLLRRSSARLIKEPDLWKDSVMAPDLIVPYRNVLFLVAGAAYAASLGARVLYSAFINSNHALEIDATSGFLDSMHRLIGETGGVRLEMPFRELSKTEVALLGLTLDVPLARTFSCQSSSTTHCGVCPNCVDRLEALSAAALAETAAST